LFGFVCLKVNGLQLQKLGVFEAQLVPPLRENGEYIIPKTYGMDAR
jgi:hypothetical protein